MEQDRDAARAVLARLGETPEARRAKAPTERERRYLETLETLYGEGDQQERDRRYAAATAALRRAYPEDPDAAAFHALALLGTAHQGRDVAVYMRAAAVLEPVFAAHPRHPGAAHYLIHSYDDPVHAPLGLRAARVYSQIAPAAAHAQHMTSHIFLALGMWDEVVAANETAAAVVDRARQRRDQPPRACGHYNNWLLYGYLQQGRYADARRVLAACRAEATRETGQGRGEHHDPDASAVGSLLYMRLRYLLDGGAWSEEVAAEVEAPTPGTRLTAEFTRGWVALDRNDVAAARAARDRLGETRAALAADLERHWQERAEILVLELAARIALAEGRNGEAIELARRAAALEEAMPFAFGPPLVDKPSHELLGELLLALDRPAEAQAAFTQALARAPERTASLLGLARAADRAGDSGAAAAATTKLRAIWQRADRVPEEIAVRGGRG
jgi:tetratricopeptide (TPR) repeat protein